MTPCRFPGCLASAVAGELCAVLSQHSPLPWAIEGSGDIMAADGSRAVSFGDEPNSCGCSDADAAYIVRAVNSHEALLTALKAAQQFLPPEIARGPDIFGWTNTVWTVHAVLAKAEG